MKNLVYCFIVFCLCFVQTALATDDISVTDCLPEIDVTFDCDSVTPTSTKELSNVVIKFCDGSEDYKYDGLSGYSDTFGEEFGKGIAGVWVKSGCNSSGDGPGYGEFFSNPYGCECEEDCLGVPNGNAVVDDCGICDGNDKDKDECGICFGSGPGECGCDLSIVKDACGVCGGDNSTCADCAGVPNGNAVVDDCGVCDGKNKDKGCDGVCFSGKVVDECDICGGPGKNECDSCDPTYRKDACGVCGGDNTSCAGCDMVPWSGKEFDECGVCDGDGTSCADCLGVPNGNAELDVCGVCDGDGTSCEIDICYLEWDFSARFPTEDPSIITIKDFEKPSYQASGLVGVSEDCDKITICYERDNQKVTAEVAKLVFPIYGANGKATEGDCIFDGLEPSACAEANGFLNQVNVATIINKLAIPLGTRVEYVDLFGIVKGSVSATIPANTKQDFIVNDLDLEPDTYGTVCVHTDAVTKGAWYGGVTAYKPDERGLGAEYDFALYYPFVNSKQNVQYAPLNTFRLGATLAANWIRITDAVRDNKPLTGNLEFFDAVGNLVSSQVAAIPDAGRFDFDGHVGLGGPDSNESVGFAKFTPSNDAKFYFTASRYFYDCPGAPRGAADCNNFLSAFVIPDRSPIDGKTFGSVTTQDTTMSVVELNNTSAEDAYVTLDVYDAGGALKGSNGVYVPSLGTTHYIVNGLLDEEVGHAELRTNGAYVSASTYTYVLDGSWTLLRGFATPFTDTPGVAQLSEFNSFLNQRNVYELHNVTSETVEATVEVYDYLGVLLNSFSGNIAPRSSLSSTLAVPSDTYGTLVIQGDGVIFRNFVTKGSEYVLPFHGK